MDECFLPMVHYKSGVNLIHNIVYNLGSNFNRLNYGGFLTAILERGDEMISVASIRIHGIHLAEMPFIATRHVYRRQGMCRRLLSAIEKALCSLSIEKLVIPAISELRETWTSVFGFNPMEGLNKQKIRNMNMVVFPGVDMLQKPLVEHQSTEESITEAEDLKTTEPKDDHTMDGMTNNVNERCLTGTDLKGSIVIRSPEAGKTNGESVAVESGSLPPHSCLDDPSKTTIENAPLTACHADTRFHDQLGVGPNNMDGRNLNTMNSTDSLFHSNVQTEQVTEHQSAVSGSTNPTNDAIQQSVVPLNWHTVSEVESKSPTVYHTGTSSASGIILHCASGGGAPEVIVLSNQAG
uniref:Uncharacterized protein LOC105126839 isoform X3 n=2 Tax=Rhizophora mucronata TaxID=61149 RepID=A0A2P2J061_RHIMU